MLTFNIPTDSQPDAICEMIAILLRDDYRVMIDPGSDDDEDGTFPVYVVQIIDTDGTKVASGSSYHLIDAMSQAYESTPERTVTDETP